MRHINAHIAYDNGHAARCVGTFDYSEQGEFDARQALSNERKKLLDSGYEASHIEAKLVYVDTEITETVDIGGKPREVAREFDTRDALESAAVNEAKAQAAAKAALDAARKGA